MSVRIIEVAEVELAEEAGRSAVVGCVATGEGTITVSLARGASTVDICVEERLPDSDPEAVMSTVDNVIEQRRTTAGIALDADALGGLLRLIRRATEVSTRLSHTGVHPGAPSS
jgi:hypothetical protein